MKGSHPATEIIAHDLLPKKKGAIMHLFAYGTLMNKETMLKISGCTPECMSAVLHGFKRLCIKGAAYPGIVPSGSDRVEGLIYFDLPASAWKRLDEYEGSIYERQSVQVETGSSRLVQASAYVVKREFYHLLEDRPWKGAQTFTKARCNIDGA